MNSYLEAAIRRILAKYENRTLASHQLALFFGFLIELQEKQPLYKWDKSVLNEALRRVGVTEEL
jgi:hypothetical protein